VGDWRSGGSCQHDASISHIGVGVLDLLGYSTDAFDPFEEIVQDNEFSKIHI